MFSWVNEIKGLEKIKCDPGCDWRSAWGCNLITSSLLQSQSGTIRVIRGAQWHTWWGWRLTSIGAAYWAGRLRRVPSDARVEGLRSHRLRDNSESRIIPNCLWNSGGARAVGCIGLGISATLSPSNSCWRELQWTT